VAPGPGVYVHIPFCAARCGYCDFATWTDRAHLVDDYVAACAAHVARLVGAGELEGAATVFVGGGTPSTLSPAQLEQILGAIPLAAGAEVTVECNPDSVDIAKLRGYRDAGVTRVSLGVQSVALHVLSFLERTHDPDNVARAVGAVRDAGIGTFNLDLIYGAPGESVDEWRRTLDAVLALSPPHVSAYALTVEAGTPLGKAVAAGASPAPDDDDQAEKYALADAVLGAAGLASYEVSNWARPGHECRHNLDCWAGADYLAVGCAAHGHRAGRRWWNVRTPERYIERVVAGLDPTAGAELLEPLARAEERFVLGFRTRDGAVIPRGARAVVEELAAAGLVRTEGPRVVLEPAGRLLAGDLTARVLAAATWDGVPAGTR
jgi:oxygen-independent coproporphyrinogen-3 oxidase